MEKLNITFNHHESAVHSHSSAFCFCFSRTGIYELAIRRLSNRHLSDQLLKLSDPPILNSAPFDRLFVLIPLVQHTIHTVLLHGSFWQQVSEY
ncbi:MAG: hypothetical protein ACLTAC_10945 [Hungatella sp.]